MHFSLLLIPLFAGFCHGSNLCTNVNELNSHLMTAFNYKRSYAQPAAKQNTLEYITNIFNNLASQYNGDSYQQDFDKIFQNNTYPGNNAILILKGSRWGTDKDRVSLLGTHFDSVTTSPGVDDNGSSSSALLESAAAVARSTCQRLNTVIFVAFDWEEYYLTGSQMFVYSHLVPEILERNNIPVNQFLGAYILDTILNYDETPRTQTFPDGFELLFPNASREVKAHDYAGDFLASIGRRDDNALMSLLQKGWQSANDNKPERSRIIDINVPFSGRPSDSPLYPFIRDLFRSDHYHFWDYEGSYSASGLKAVFLTDTAEFRGFMTNCYHKECDNTDNITPQRLQYLAAITNAITNSLLEMANESEQCKC